MKTKHLLAISALLLTGVAHAGGTITPITQSFSSNPGILIPDGDLSGLLTTITPATTIGTIGTITSMTVTLNISGGWTGDLYAYLWHDGILSVLVNRPGLTSSAPAGSSNAGLNVTLDDTAFSNLHSGAVSFGIPLNGTFQPDGRDVHPLSVLDTSPVNDHLKETRWPMLAFFAGEVQANAMPQIQLPIFPASSTAITSELAFEQRDGQVYYFNGHFPVFTHPVEDIASFRFFTRQLIATETHYPGTNLRLKYVPLRSSSFPLGQDV